MDRGKPTDGQMSLDDLPRPQRGVYSPALVAMILTEKQALNVLFSSWS